MKKMIYAADDEENIREILATFLVDAGYDVEVFENGTDLWERFLEKPADLLILDIMMPGMSGLELTKKIREISNVPIVILTARDTDMDYVLGINSGSDDYMTKPFRPSILMSRIKALFRRIDMDAAQTKSTGLSFGDLVYSEKDHAIFVDGKNLNLTNTELELLKYMISQEGRAVSREDLLQAVWGISVDLETRVTDETVRRIRKKLSSLKSCVALNTVWGFGYKLEVIS